MRRMSEAIASADADALTAIIDEIAVTQPAIATKIRGVEVRIEGIQALYSLV